MKVVIREATTDDVDQIQRLYDQLDEYHVSVAPDVFQSVAASARLDSLVANQIMTDGSSYLVAELDGRLVGFLNISRCKSPAYPMFRPQEFATIENAVVDEAKRGQGIGPALFNAAKRWAVDHGLNRIRTNVWSSNDSAREFYRDLGFVGISEKMELRLQSDTAEQAAAPDEPSARR